MKIKTLTMYVIGAFVFGLIAYDFYAYLNAGQDSTVSNVMIEWSHEYPAVTFLVGFVMGHLFWQMHKEQK